jgi:hypothetical protein
MAHDGNDLLVYYVVGGFALGLAWAAVMGEVVLGRSRAVIRGGHALLLLVGLVHPVAALGAWDVARLDRSDEEVPAVLGRWALPASVAVTAIGLAGAALVLWDGW